MRNPTFSFVRPSREGTSGETIERSVRGDIKTELGMSFSGPDPRRGPADHMSPGGFIAWLCGLHTNLERNILVESLVTDLRRAVDGKVAIFLKTAGARALRVDMRLGQIARADLKLLRRHARTRTLQVQAVEDARTGVLGAACYVDSEIIGVFAARDVVVLER